MKKITFLLMLLTMSLGFSQNSLPLTFETGNNPFLPFDNGATSANVNNPDMTGNTSTKVIEFVRTVGSAWYSGMIFDVNLRPANSPLVTIATTGKVFTVKVRSSKPNVVIRFQLEAGYPDTGVSPSYEVFQTVTTANVWTTLTFDFTSQAITNAMAYKAISIFPDWNTANQNNVTVASTYQFDDFIAVNATAPTCSDGVQNGNETGVDCGGPDCAPCTSSCSDGIMNGNETGVDCGGPDCAPCAPTAPTTAAPIPSPMQSQVINMYSNSYTTDVNVESWRSSWSSSTYTDNILVAGAGSECKRYIDADFVGVEFYNDNDVDATTMNYFHVDVWTPNATTFRVKLVDLDAGVVEGEIAFPMFTTGQWVSLDIPLADFANPALVTNPANLLTSRNSIQQLIFSGLPTGTFDFYVDNVYFSTVESLGVNEFDTVTFKVYPNPSQNEWTIKSNDLVSSIELYDVLGKQVMSLNPNTLISKIDGSGLSKGLYFARVNSNGAVSTVKLIKN